MTDPSEYPNQGYDEWIDAIAAGEGYHLVCPEGHGSLPPRRICPECGAGGLAEEPLPASGEIETYSVTHVASPRFEDDAPYAIAIATFGDVAITGQVRDVSPENVDAGMVVTVDVDESATDDEPVVVFRPR
ncbi:nucleic acid-binding protein [Halobacteriales archaeon QS_1_68_20]|nr:MAG: nucleic acid-binding protein [Halobacteriales archaeon QS_1_68_20]